MRREASATSTSSAPGELEFSEWLARMEESQSKPRSVKDMRAASRASKVATSEGDKEERKKKKRSWVNLLVR